MILAVSKPVWTGRKELVSDQNRPALEPQPRGAVILYGQ